MNFYRNEKSLLTTDTQFILAGAFALSGDRRTFVELLPPEFKTEEAVRTSGYCFDSPIRANALILNILLDTDLNNSNIPRYMDYLSKTYRRYYWHSTQDNAFTLLAFGKAARELLADRKRLRSIANNGKRLVSENFDIDSIARQLLATIESITVSRPNPSTAG